MTYTRKTMFDRVLAVMLSILMVVALMPVSVIGVAAEANSTYAIVSTYTGGTITGNGTANVEVLVENTTLAWVEGNALRAEGWWVGIDVVAPEGFSENATYRMKTNPTAEYGAEKSFAQMKDGPNDLQLWFPVSPDSLEKFASEGRNLTMVYAFDWNADGTDDQTIEFSVAPSEKIVLMKGEDQIYPQVSNYGTVTTYTGGTVTGSGTADVRVLVEETTLQWVEANALRAEGWWVGIDVVAPEGFSEDATYKSKPSPTAEYSAPKSFAAMKDGPDDLQMWFPVSPDSLESFAAAGYNLTYVYAFDWNADGEYEQEVEFSVVPSEKIVLMKGEDQVYPVLKSTVTVSKNEGGSVSLNGDTTGTLVVENGTTVNVEVEAEAGYQISKVIINGSETVVDAKTFNSTIENIVADATVSVTFVKLYTVTVTSNDKGSVSTTPEGQGGSVTVVDGSIVTVTAIPETGYRVSGVKINGVEQTVSGANDSGYTVELTADTEYAVEVTFAPNIYKVEKEEADNGDFEVKNPSVEHGGSTTVVVTPGAGYTVDTFKVEGATVSDIVKDATGIWFTVSNIKSDVKVVVTFKATAKANAADVSKDTENVALRKNETLFVVKDGDVITFKTEKNGMRMYGDLGLITGDATTQTINIPGDTNITSIELYYQADGELYADWHVVEMNAITVAEDVEKPTLSLTPAAPATNGYYNTDVTLNVSVEDKNYYSGISKIEYWITLNDVPGQTVKLYEYEDAAEVKAVYEDSIVVNASTYNSKNVKVTIRVLDRAGNEEIVEKEIKINSTKPAVSLAIDGTQNNNAQEGYYNDKRELTITIIDREDTFSKANVAKGLEIYKDGTLIEVATTDITWKHTDGSNQYEVIYVFADDAHYKWSFNYTNIAGLSNDGVAVDANSKDIYEFYVDKAAPYNLAINYNPNFIGVLLDTITFGFYGQDSIEVTVEAIDDTAGIEQFEYTYGNVTQTISGAAIARDGDKASATFSIPAQFRGSVSVKATDRAGRSAELADDKVVVIDTIAPGVTVTWSSAQGYNGKYFNTDRIATIEIEESNFFAQDVEDGLLNITAHIVYNDGSSKEETYKPEFHFENGKYVAAITFSEEADYTFDVTYTDRAGNVYDAYPAEDFTIDKTGPVISVEFDNNTAINENHFKAERKATITVVEHNFNEAAMNVLVDGNKAQVEWRKVENAVDTYAAEYTFTGDAHYTFGVNGKDFADNANDGVATAEDTVAPWAFTVDKSSPVGLKISYEPTFIGTLLEGLTFGFYQAPVTVKIEATDDISGIDYFTYSYTVQDSVSTINVGKEKVKVDANGANFITFDIPAQFRGFVSFEVTNKAGVSASTADTNAVVVDNIAPGIDVIYGNYDALNDKYYKADRTATITIDEANFFAKDIEDGMLVITRKAVANDGTVKEEILAPQFTKIEGTDKYVATVVFDQDADYTFDIKYTDRSGNVYDDYDADEFTVDKIAPKISIEKANGAYFNADRTVKITVVEHNFRASDFEFDAEAYDVTGKMAINLDSKDYKNYLKNQSSWTQVAPDTWEAVITFDIEGNYKVSAAYSDLAGNSQEVKIEDTFCVDKQDTGKNDPNNLKITYKPTFIGTILETITFGFYQAPVEVTIEATDDIAGVDHFVYSYAVQEGASSINVGKINQEVVATRDGETNRWYATFTIDPQFRGYVSFTAYDKATNHAYLADENVVIVDNVAPGINVRYENMNEYDIGYFDAQRKAIIEITEANFFAQDIADGLLVITVEKTTDAGAYTSTVMTPTFVKDASREDVYVAEIPFVDAGDYTFDIKYTDRSGNVYDSYEKDVFTVDMTAPEISVSYDNNSAKNNDQFKADREATIHIVEHNFDPTKVVATVTANGAEVESYAEYLAKADSWTEVEGEADTWEAKIQYTEEAHYTFAIACTDKAGNVSSGVNYGESKAPTQFTLDKSAPTAMDITINNESVAGSMDTLAFNKFYGNQIVIKLSANCDISGLESLKYQKVAGVDDYNADGTWTPYNAETGIVVDPSEKLVIYFRAEDRAGNVDIIRSTGIVVDNKQPEGETNAPEIDILPAAPNSNGMYKGDVSVDLKVVDPKYSGTEAANNGYYSGLNKITYKIYTTDSSEVEEGILFDIATNANKGTVLDEADGLVNSWSANINVDSKKFNSNNVYIEVTAIDNAGNARTTTTKAGQLKIDITAPVIDIEYDNNTVDSATYFDAIRKATITIRERNFKNEEVVIIITHTDDNGVVTKTTVTPNFAVEKDGEAPKAHVFDGEDRDGSVYYVYTMDYTFAEEGDYEFEIEYVDLAGNECTEKNFAPNTAVGTEYAFTVDLTKPVIEVSYNNNSARNGNYYKADRTATIVVTEHNFDESRAVITATATDDGKEITAPVASKWTSNGNTHTATIYYNKDAKYTFDISVRDKAGNASVDYKEETFFVDKTNPVLTIEKIVDESANNDEGDIGFVMTATDTNFDVFTPVLTAVVKNGNGFETKELDVGKITDIKNGKVLTVTNIEEDGIYRITCTVVDKAGNAFSEVVLENADGTKYTEKRAGTNTLLTFSVNRDGSAFELDNNTADMVAQYYVQNVENDVAIIEINVDPLTEYSVTINGKAIQEGKDYTVTEDGGDGAWKKYTYRINKGLFIDEGEYKVVVSSKDKAENDAFSDVKDAAISFVVDRTAPVVTISGIDDNGRYQTDKQQVSIIPTDHGGALNSLIVNMVDGNGDVIMEMINLSGEALIAELEAKDGMIQFEVGEGLYQNVQIICTDCATDASGATNTYEETVSNVSVSTSGFMIFWANKPLRWGVIGGVSAVIIAVAALVILKKKKAKA